MRHDYSQYDRFITYLRRLKPEERPELLNELPCLFCFNCGCEPDDCVCPDWELEVGTNGHADE